jgi:hypothetical protein
MKNIFFIFLGGLAGILEYKALQTIKKVLDNWTIQVN